MACPLLSAAQSPFTPSPRGHTAIGFAAHPQSVSATAGAEVTLATLLRGPVKSIIWRKNGVPIPDSDSYQITVLAPDDPLRPDRYEAEIRDAFGNHLLSQGASVSSALRPMKAASIEPAVYNNWLKLQAIFELPGLFQTATYALEEEVGGWHKGPDRILRNLSACQAQPGIEVISAVPGDTENTQGLKLVLDGCMIRRFNVHGEERNMLYSGQYLQSIRSFRGTDSETWKHERFARDLRIAFDNTPPSRHDTTANFDTTLNGKLTHTREIQRVGDQHQRLRETFEWSKGSSIVNPQTGVSVIFQSGTFVREYFGKSTLIDTQPERSSEYFKDLRLLVNGKTLVLDGLVNRVYSAGEIKRTGQFTLSVNGKKVLVTSGSATPLQGLDGDLPYVPKFVGVFTNDHLQAPKSPARARTAMVTGQARAN